MDNLKLILSYDGTDYLGWQDANTGASIEGTLRAVLTQILQQEVLLQGASRTDAGVHAEGQVVNFFLEKPKNLHQLLKSLNQLLPKSIRILSIQPVHEKFHPSLDAKEKEYHYTLSRSSIQPPFKRLFSWHYPHPLDLETMQLGAKTLLGKQDFIAFGNSSDPKPKETICNLSRLDIISEGEELRFEIQGDRFLYKMVRNLVGTLVCLGAQKLPLEDFQTLIQSRDRTRGGVTAPAHGLLLKRVFYEQLQEVTK
jgi:tRNA pseudouridine38-40 synthase